MTKKILYVYLGTNGVITSPVHLEDVYHIRKVQLTADIHKALTKDGLTFHHQVIVPEQEAAEWYEVKLPQDN